MSDIATDNITRLPINGNMYTANWPHWCWCWHKSWLRWPLQHTCVCVLVHMTRCKLVASQPKHPCPLPGSSWWEVHLAGHAQLFIVIQARNPSWYFTPPKMHLPAMLVDRISLRRPAVQHMQQVQLSVATACGPTHVGEHGAVQHGDLYLLKFFWYKTPPPLPPSESGTPCW
jgi:hypothetical protein